jgi:hypothetical protein
MTDSGQRPRLRLDEGPQRYLASAFAIVVSLITLWVAVTSNHTQERMLAASTWPTLEYGTGNRDDEGRDLITLELGNNGIGPARLRGVQVFYKGERVRNSVDLLKHCCELHDQPIQTVTSGTRGRVLKAGDRITFMAFPKAINPEEIWKRFNQERFKVEVRACYCSVLNDCWNFDSTRTNAEPMKSCPALAVEEEWNG